MSNWTIKGYDSLKKTYEEDVSDLNQEEVIVILQRLVCMHLTAEEIVSSSVGGRSHLKPRLDRNASGFLTVAVGSNPHYLATVN